MKKIALFSGTFDPPHVGHEWLVKHVLEKLRFDEVWVLVEPEPRHKDHPSELHHRQAMVEKLFADRPEVKVDPLSIMEDHHSLKGTFEAAKRLAGDVDPNFWLVVGGDVFEFVPDWDDIEEYQEQIGFIVALRTEDDGEVAMGVAARMPHLLYKLVPSEQPGVSSTKLRKKIREGGMLGELSSRVIDYVTQHDLYREDKS